jgi:Lhr-like helicase
VLQAGSSRRPEDAQPRRARAGRARRVFRRDDDAGRHLHLRRRGAALRGHRRERGLVCSRTSAGTDPKIPSYAGGKFPLSTYLASAGARHPGDAEGMGEAARRGLVLAACCSATSRLPQARRAPCRDLPARTGASSSSPIPFEGRLAHQTLGMLLTRRLERARLAAGLRRLDYAIAVWTLGDMGAAIARGALSLDDLFDEDMLGDDLEAWLAESALMKRTFRNCAVIAGLIERRHPGQEKTGRQVTMIDRPRLRRAAAAPAGPHPPAGDARRCGDGASRHRPAGSRC